MSKKKKKKIITIICAVLVVLLIAGGTGFYFYSNRFIYNKEGDTGNTTGNLYNGGMFCVYDGFVYFANPNDEGRLYRMKEDGSGVEKIGKDSVIYLCEYQTWSIQTETEG